MRHATCILPTPDQPGVVTGGAEGRGSGMGAGYGGPRSRRFPETNSPAPAAGAGNPRRDGPTTAPWVQKTRTPDNACPGS